MAFNILRFYLSANTRITKLEEKAKEMGITVDQLKAKMKADRQVRQKAKELGITVDELKRRM